MLKLDIFSQLVGTETAEIVCWDNINLSAAREIFLPYLDSIVGLLKFTAVIGQDKYVDSERFFCDGRKLSNMLCFLSAIVQNSESIFNTEALPLINAELQDWNCYDDPPWVLWKHYLQDILDALMLWKKTAADDRTQCYLYNFLNSLPLT